MPKGYQHSRWRTALAGCTVLWAVGAAAVVHPAPTHTLGVSEATLRMGRDARPVVPVANLFGPGVDGVSLGGALPAPATQLEWRLPADFPGGDYAIGLPTEPGRWAHRFFDWTARQRTHVRLYHNDRRVRWDGYTWPERSASDPNNHYQAELRTGIVRPLAPGDSIRVVFASRGNQILMGPLRLYPQAPNIDLPFPFHAAERLGPPSDHWLYAEWQTEPTNEPPASAHHETAVFFNPGALPLQFTVRAEAHDHYQRPLLETEETITLAPGEETLRTYEFEPNGMGPFRLNVIAGHHAFHPPQRLIRYYGANRTAGPRPRLSLNGPWEYCYAPGVEPESEPPEDAPWEAVNIPSWQPNAPGHIAWYRKRFAAPESIVGERILLRFGSVFSEAWIYVNGVAVRHRHQASLPFEADITEAYRPDGENEVLVAVRDWLAYSPTNRERVLRGERPVQKTDMLATPNRAGFSHLGLAGSIWLEARPALAVDDVFVVTRTTDRTLNLRYRIRNDGGETREATVRPVILEQGEPVLRLEPQHLTVPAHGTAEFTLETPWPDARFWTPETPHLYVLETEVGDGGATDRHGQRFGFREARMEGISFYLNDVRRKLRSQWTAGAHAAGGRTVGWAPCGTPERRMEAMWRWQMHNIHDRQVQISRTHNNRAGVEESCAIADETGLMIKVESDVLQERFTLDEQFWNAILEQNVALVKAYKNHASVVQWSAGNENMWGWHYLGELAQRVGTQWQVAIAKAMQAADRQHRPVDWSADGDLKGNWNYYSLHYPRELSGHPNLPNSAWWGPLDGETTIPYSMGPVVLGAKPIITGEAFWPAFLSRPFAPTILFGDLAYAGSAPQYAAWIDSSAFFLNGFRDAEFAMIDTYLPLSLLQPQTLVFKEETRSFFGGRTVTRRINVHHDLPEAAQLEFHWQLLGPNGAEWADGTEILDMAPAELRRLNIEANLPETTTTQTAVFTAQVRANEQWLHREQRTWTIHPPPTVDPPAGIDITLFDPEGETAALFERLGIPFEPLEELRAPERGALVVGRNAFRDDPAGPWAASLAAFTAAGGRVAILAQTRLPHFLPTPLTPVTDRPMTMAYVRATDHPVMAGLGDDDLRWWADDHEVSRNHFLKPLQGNVLPLADFGSVGGLTESPLLEVYHGRGSYLLCQFLLEDKAQDAPAAARLLQNILAYLAQPEPYRIIRPVALLAGTNHTLRATLQRLNVHLDDLAKPTDTPDPQRHGGVIADASVLTDPATVEALRHYAETGGRVWLHRIAPQQRAAAETLTGIGLRLRPVGQEPRDIQNRVLRRQGSGWMAGISNHDLFWGSNTYLQELRREGNWHDAYPGGACPPDERIADYYAFPADDDAQRVSMLTHPPALLEIPVGDGAVLINQLRLEEPHNDSTVTAERLFSLLLTHLGAQIGDGLTARSRLERLRDYEFFTVDLSAHANRGIRDDPEAGITGWTNQGENDARELPTGRQTFAGVPFLLATPRTAVVLYSVNAGNTDLPREATGIHIGRHADALFFLHTAAWGGSGRLFHYRVNYEDGETVDIPIQGDQQTYDWWADPVRVSDRMERYGAFVAWQGRNPMRDPVMLPGYEWNNPHPEKTIATIDFISNPDSRSVPVLVAITGARREGNEGVVTDVLGTAGIRVRIGGRERDFYYIGTTGIEADHPYYEPALAAHRDMVLGQRVTIEFDTVRENDTGHTIAYVFTGSRWDLARNLVNGRIIGDGLGRMGNFAGNIRHAAYLENMQFIARQRDTGLWGAEE